MVKSWNIDYILIHKIILKFDFYKLIFAWNTGCEEYINQPYYMSQLALFDREVFNSRSYLGRFDCIYNMNGNWSYTQAWLYV